MPLPGGSSDKIGNRFELWWTALCLVDLLDERAESIIIEPPGDLGDGIEFILTRKSVREHHQVKRQTARALGWSIAQLASSDVLKHVRDKLGGNSDEFHFVSTMGAPDLAELSTNARQSSDFGQFRSGFLAAGRRKEKWNDLNAIWQPTNELECYDLLRRTHIDTISEDLLRSQVLARVAALVGGPDRHAANELVVLALDSVNLPLTADRLWSHLRAASLPRRAWAREPHAIKALDDSNQRFLASRRREFFRALFPQPLAIEICKDLRDADATNSLITSEAGGGKSGVVVQLIEGLEQNQIPYLAVRLDRLDPTLRTAAQIGQKLDLPGSPVPLLAAIAQSRRSVLILDQLDAISLISGKNPELFDPVCDLLQEATAFPEMRVVVACRAFDLDSDHRLRKLTANSQFVRRAVSPLARGYVLEGIAEAGFDTAGLSEKQIEVLSNPLNLSLLAEIRPSSPKPVGVETSIDLFDAFWKRKQKDVERLGVSAVEFNEAIETLCQLLEERGALFVPEPLFLHLAAERLASAHVFSCSDQKWSFFHESFYDFANARRLYRLGKPLTEYLMERGQGIELRNQLRQSLAFRRAVDSRRYCEDLKALLADDRIRFHLKSAAVAFLRGLAEPTAAEWEVVGPLTETAPGSDLGRALFSMVGASPSWFNVARDSGAIRRWLESPDPTVQRLLVWVLFQVERREPGAAISLLQEAYALGVEGQRLAAAVLQHAELATSRSVFDLYLKLLGDWLFEPVSSSSPVPWMRLYTIVVKEPAWACEAFGLVLRKAVQTALSHGAANPFSDELGLLQDDQLDDQVIQRAYRGAPITFLHQTWQSIVDIVAANLEKGAGSTPPYRDSVWRHRSARFHHRIHEKLLRGVEAGIRALAVADFEGFVAIVRDAFTLRAATIDCLLVQGYASAAQNHPNEAIGFLLSDESLLSVGPHDDPQGPAQELIRTASQTCSKEVLASLETALLAYYPDWESKVERAVGYSQYRLLSSIPESARSERVRQRLHELGREFGPLGEPPSPPSNFGLLGPPIRPDATDAMTDDQWLAAMAQYPMSGPNRLPDGSLNSGALGLAQELTRVARNDPERFGKLMERIPKNANPAYFEAIIMAMGDESVPVERALAACGIGHQLEGRPLGQSIAYCVGKIALIGPSPEAVSMVCVYIDAAFPEHVRNSAYLTLANLLIADRTRIGLALPSLELSARQVPRELRGHFCYALSALFGTPFQERVKDLFSPMWALDPWLPADPVVEQFLNLAFRREYGHFIRAMEALLSAAEPEIRAMAARQASIAEMVVPDASAIAVLLSSGDEHVRRGVAEACAVNVRFAQVRDYCAQRLTALFSDPDATVRAAASDCFRELADGDLADLWGLVTAFLDSPAADKHQAVLLDCLLRSTIRHDIVTLRACDQAVEQALRGKESAHLELPLCRDLVLRTYHQSADDAIRERSLDLIDRLLGLEVEGLERALFDIETRR
jgi:hypothetical protein